MMQRPTLEGAERIRYYVNYEANDIMAFSSLYTKQTALFLLITVILLTAMIGAIILATKVAPHKKFLLTAAVPGMTEL